MSKLSSSKKWVEHRISLSGPARWGANKIFPEHWSFLLGELAMFGFVILVLTGIFLTLFFEPSSEMVVYEGANELYNGQELPAAFESIMRITYDVPGGLFMRRLHRSATHLFLGAGLLHLMRIMLTGAFRKPRELNVIVGLIIVVLGVVGGLFGYSLPYDSLAGMGLRVTHAITMQSPFIGDWMANMLFGGEFPNDAVLPRIYILHVLVIPLIIGGVLGLHMFLMVQNKHTAMPSKYGDGHDFVIGKPAWPGQAAESGSLFFWVVGLLALFQVVVPWSDVANLGPYVPAEGGNNAQPDWFMFFLEGLLRLMPAFELHIAGTTITSVTIGALGFPAIMLVTIMAYPFIEAKMYKLEGDWHVLTNPFDIPLRGAFVFFWFTLINLLALGAANDILSRWMGISIESINGFLRIAVLVLPIAVAGIIFFFAKRRLDKKGLQVARTEQEALGRILLNPTQLD